MKIKIDENIPISAAAFLAHLGHDVHTIFGEGLTGFPDPEVWQAAQREKRFLITQDLDFSDIRRFAPGTHIGLLLVRLHSPSREELAKRIAEIFQTEDVDQWQGCFVVATERKIRVRRPTN